MICITEGPESGCDQEFGHVRILDIGDIRPSPENAKLYRPVDAEDPDVIALAESIRDHGIQEPLVVSADGWILSGHRRYVAAQLADLTEVPCRVHDIRKDTDPDGFVVLLREFNRQRVKSFDEIVREEVVSCDLEEAHVALLDYRDQQSKVDVVPMPAGAAKPRARISRAKVPMLVAINKILIERRE